MHILVPLNSTTTNPKYIKASLYHKYMLFTEKQKHHNNNDYIVCTISLKSLALLKTFLLIKNVVISTTRYDILNSAGTERYLRKNKDDNIHK